MIYEYLNGIYFYIITLDFKILKSLKPLIKALETVYFLFLRE